MRSPRRLSGASASSQTTAFIRTKRTKSVDCSSNDFFTSLRVTKEGAEGGGSKGEKEKGEVRRAGRLQVRKHIIIFHFILFIFLITLLFSRMPRENGVQGCKPENCDEEMKGKNQGMGRKGIRGWGGRSNANV